MYHIIHEVTFAYKILPEGNRFFHVAFGDEVTFNSPTWTVDEKGKIVGFNLGSSDEVLRKHGCVKGPVRSAYVPNHSRHWEVADWECPAEGEVYNGPIMRVDSYINSLPEEVKNKTTALWSETLKSYGVKRVS
jgi:hypothetical protein